MNTFLQVLLAIAGIAMASLVIYRTTRAYRRYRGKMLVTCPENHKAVAVEIDAVGAAVSAATGAPTLMLADCARWPEMQRCGQRCLNQIEKSPEDCQVRTILGRWFEGRKCAYCGREFDEIRWHAHKPVLLTPDREFVEWPDVPVEDLPRLLETCSTACYDCLIAETFRRERPGLVTDRLRHP